MRALATPEGYKLMDQPRASRSAGGSGLLFRDCLQVTMIASGEWTSFEFSEWLVVSGTYRLRLVVIYRVPYSAEHPVSTDVFFSEFSDYMETVIMSTEKFFILGDFNIHVDVPSDVHARKLQDLFDCLGLEQHVREPTHTRGHTLDLMISRKCKSVIDGSPRVDRLFSDHFSVVCGLQTPKPAVSVKKHTYRNLKSVNIDQLRSDLMDSELCVNPPSDLENLVSCYNTTLSDTLDRYAPLKTRVVSVRPRLPWFDEDIREAKRARRKAEKRWRKTNSLDDFDHYRKCRNRVTYLLNSARIAFYRDFIEDNSTDQGKLFRATRRLLKHDILPPHDDKFQLANDMGNFFVKKVTNIRKELDDAASGACCDPAEYDFPRSVAKSFHEFTPLSDEDVIALVQRSSKKCCALDPMPTKLASDCIDVLLPTIKHIINLSLDNAYFPHVWKEALVNPLLKRFGVDPLYKNFRPVSNLPYVSKLVERSASDQLFAHMSSNGLYPDLQSAYVKNHSTETALLRVKNDILMNMNKGHVILLVFLDLSAAFDTVDHNSLLTSLQTRFGVSGKVLEWFASYLHDRSQRITIN